MKSLRTKFKCIEKIENCGSTIIKLEVVESGNSGDNEAYHSLYPEGEIEIKITNCFYSDFFKAENEYYVDFSHSSIS